MSFYVGGKHASGEDNGMQLGVWSMIYDVTLHKKGCPELPYVVRGICARGSDGAIESAKLWVAENAYWV